jgi:hypothetical protein
MVFTLEKVGSLAPCCPRYLTKFTQTLTHHSYPHATELMGTFQPRLFKMRKHFFPNANPFDGPSSNIERADPVYAGRLLTED